MRQTRSAIVHSFNGMVLQRPYDAIQVGEIAGQAGVGRSTFYEHFRDKDALLKHAVSGLLGVLADAVTERADRAKIEHVLRHFWDNRRAARARFSGDSRSQVSRWLADLIEARLRSGDGGSALRIPSNLAAAQIADAQIGLIRAWLEGDGACASDSAARALHATSAAMVEALRATNTAGAA